MAVLRVRARRFAGLRVGAALVLAAGVAGCGGGGGNGNPTIARVGSASIDKRAVAHWASIIGHGAIVSTVADAKQPAELQALTLLIYSHWLIGEASEAGQRPTRQELERVVQQQERSMPRGPAEFKELLSTSGETVADTEFEAKARWCAVALARHLRSLAASQGKQQASPAAVSRFYRMHIDRYRLRERRFYDLIEGIPSRATASALARRLGTGPRFAVKASKERPFRPKTFADLPGQATVYRAAFSAKVGVLVGPLPLQGAYALFVLRRIERPRLQALAEVRATIEHRLLTTVERRARARWLESFRRRWTARTDCRPGYVVQKCRQYRGLVAAEYVPLADY
jgi:foldase protein PrsA